MPKNKENLITPKAVEKPVMKAKIPVRATKVIRNVALQAWSIPTGQHSVRLRPGESVSVPISAISERVLNLQKRRLITIS